MRVGRQPVTWGEGRLLGAADWSPTGRSLDAVRGHLVTGDWAFELLAVALWIRLSPPPGGGGVRRAARRARRVGDRSLSSRRRARARALRPAAPRRGSSSRASRARRTRAHCVCTARARLDVGGGGRGSARQGRRHLARPRGVGGRRSRGVTPSSTSCSGPSVRVTASYATGDHGGATYRRSTRCCRTCTPGTGSMDLFSWSNEAEANLRVAIAPWTDGVAAVEYRYARLAQPEGSWRSGTWTRSWTRWSSRRRTSPRSSATRLTRRSLVPLGSGRAEHRLLRGRARRRRQGAPVGGVQPPGRAHAVRSTRPRSLRVRPGIRARPVTGALARSMLWPRALGAYRDERIDFPAAGQGLSCTGCVPLSRVWTPVDGRSAHSAGRVRRRQLLDVGRRWGGRRRG